MGKARSSDVESFDSESDLKEAFTTAVENYSYTEEQRMEGWHAQLPDMAAVKRYMIARKGDLTAAVDQFVSAEFFFHKLRVDTIEAPDPLEPLYTAMCPHLNAGYGREGEPLYYEKTGAIDSAELVRLAHPKDLVWRHVRQQQLFLTRCKRKTEETGELVEKQIIISDLKGLSLWPNRRAIDVFKETIRIDQAFYPERLKALYFINAPFIFKGIWAFVRPWLDPVTKDKFHVLGSNYQDILLEKISPENLLVEYGGTMDTVAFADPVPLTKEQIALLRERAHDIEAGDTSRGHYVSGEYPPGAALPLGGVATHRVAMPEDPDLAARMSNARVISPLPDAVSVDSAPTTTRPPRPRSTSPPWVIHGEHGSMWV